jgi:PEP-CTERM motif
MKSFIRICVLGCSFLALASAGTIWHEGDNGEGGAGGLPNGANVTIGEGSLTDIIGTLSDETAGADMYEIYISDPANFSATTAGHGGNPIVNPSIYLFDSTGAGLFGNDNLSGGDSQAEIPAGTLDSLSAGLYYVLITPSGNLPENKNGESIFGDLTNTTTVGAGSSSPLIIRKYGTSGTTPDPADSGSGYDIQLTGAEFAVQTPEPTTLGFAVVGLAALALRARRAARR